jgi:hypothetical protein
MKVRLFQEHELKIRRSGAVRQPTSPSVYLQDLLTTYRMGFRLDIVLHSDLQAPVYLLIQVVVSRRDRGGSLQTLLANYSRDRNLAAFMANHIGIRAEWERNESGALCL